MRGLWILSIFLLGSVLLLSASVSGVPAGSLASSSSQGEEDQPNEDYHEDDNGEDDTEDEDLSEGTKTAEITTEPVTLDVDVGEEFQLFCDGDMQQLVVVWEKVEKDSPKILFLGDYSQSNDNRLMLRQGSSRLIVKDVRPEDSGKYKCHVMSSSTPVEVVHTVNVRVAPRVSVDPPVRVVKHGDTVTLACNVTGYPKPTVSWERKNKRMPDGQKKTEGTMITFAAVTRHHSGTYECFAVNEKGAARTAIQLEILYPPEIEVVKESVNTGHGLDADLVCLVHAEPKATVVWYKDGQQVRSNSHEAVEKMSHRYILHVKDVTESDFGSYECTANNTYGRDNRSILLSGAPSQPIFQDDMSRVGADLASYTLVWVLESTVKIDRFRMKFRQAEKDWEEIEVMGSETAPYTYTVTHEQRDLIPGTDYEVTLMAENTFGWSRESRPKIIHISGRDIQSSEAENEPGAKAVESIGGGASGIFLSSSSIIALFLTILTSNLLRW